MAVSEESNGTNGRVLHGCNSVEVLPLSIERLSGLQQLAVSNFELTDLPPGMGDLAAYHQLDMSESPSLSNASSGLAQVTDLQRLSLSCVLLKELPRWMWQLTCLQELYLIGCKLLVELPLELGQLMHLKRLYVIGCECLKELPVSVGHFVSLIELNLSMNKSLAELPSVVGQLTTIQQIDLEACDSLSKLPSELGQLTNLQQLNLSGCTSLTELPLRMCKLTKLRTLLLTECKSIAKLPSQIGNLACLEQLDLSQCTALEELPSGLGKLTNLQLLSVSVCTSLLELPSELGHLTALRELQLSKCTLLTKLPTWLGLTCLEQLDLSGCASLEELPLEIGMMMALRHLCLRGCVLLKELPSALGQLTNLQSIDLAECKALLQLPTELGQLTGLWRINLSKCKELTSLPPGLGQLTLLQNLDLSGCVSLTELPSELSQLTLMQELNLSWSLSLSVLPSELGKLTNLLRLYLLACKSLVELPPELGFWTNLRELRLPRCENLAKLPAELGQLTCLACLDLSDCTSLKVLPAEVEELTLLEILNVSGAKLLVDLPSGLEKLISLRELLLSGCQSLQKLPRLGRMTDMQSLDLSGCNSLVVLPSGLEKLNVREVELSGCTSLTALPSEIGELTELRRLCLSACYSLWDLPPAMGKLTGLQHLNVGSKELMELPSECRQLTGLRKLKLCLEIFKEVPTWLGELTSLEELDLSDCTSLTALPSQIGQLTGLTRLDLGFCRLLKELPAELGQLTNLQKLRLVDVHLHTPPQDVVKQGVQPILQYLQDLSKGSVPCHLVKLTLVGDPCAGKSSLHDSLQAGRPQPRQESDRTVGVDVSRWMLDEISPVIAHVYDVAGHRVYHASHRLFMSRDCLYLNAVRCDQSTDKAASAVLKWIDLVQTASPGCVMVVVGTCRDLCSNDVDVFMEEVMCEVEKECTSVTDEIATELEKLEGVIESKIGAIDEFHWRRLRGERDREMRKFEAALFTEYTDSGLGPLHELHIPERFTAHDSDFKFLVKDFMQGMIGGISLTEELDFLAPNTAHSARPWPAFPNLADLTGSEGAQHTDVVGDWSRTLTETRAQGSVAEDVCVAVPLKAAAAACNFAPGSVDEQTFEMFAADPETPDLDSNLRLFGSSPPGQVLRLPSADLIGDSDSEGSDNVDLSDSECNESLPLSWQDASDASVSRLEGYHRDMFEVECKWGNSDLLSRITELRNLRTDRPRVIFCSAVSNTTGEGLADLRAALLDILSSKDLFPHLGMKVPLNYMMLDRCMRQATIWTQDLGGDEGVRMADWEVACEAYHAEKTHEFGIHMHHLCEVCSDPVVKLSNLVNAAGLCGITYVELISAIQFLHSAGSLLYFGREEGEDRKVLCEFVFSRPTWIIDAVKCLVHETKQEDLNDEFRAMLKRAEDRFAGDLCEYRQAGTLTDKLLRGLWGCYRDTRRKRVRLQARDTAGADFGQYHAVLISLLCSLRLMRRIDTTVPGTGTDWKDDEEDCGPLYVVPAMFPEMKMPVELIEPLWLPAKARDSDAFMRRQYKGMGHVPYGFLSELQVQWSCKKGNADHCHAENDMFASSLGSYLVSTYGKEGGEVEEHVVVSTWEEDEQPTVQTRLCVMAWTGLRTDLGCSQGVATWELFKQVTACIEKLIREKRCSLLSTDPTVPWVDENGRWYEVKLGACRRSLKQGKKEIRVGERWLALDEFLPIEKVIVRSRGKKERQGGESPELPAPQRPGILAFYAQERADGINVHREAQDLASILCNWRSMEFEAPHVQPTFEDFRKALLCTRNNRSNVKMIHLSGHGEKSEGFYWLKDRTGLQSVPANPAFVTEQIARTAVAAGGTVECVVLNACETEGLGQALRQAGIKHVICWRWEVDDEAAAEFSRAFYECLLFRMDKGEKLDSDLYKQAFRDGMMQVDVWEKSRPSSAQRKRIGADLVQKGRNGVMFLSVDGDDLSCPSLKPTMTSRSERQSSALAKPESPLVSIASGKPGLVVLCAQERADLSGCAFRETPTSLKNFEFVQHVQLTRDEMRDAMVAARRGVRIVHLSGHGDRREGFYWRQDTQSVSNSHETSCEFQPLHLQWFRDLVSDAVPAKGGLLECVVLNAQGTEEMARDLLQVGVKHVICWGGVVDDEAASAFFRAFYELLDISMEAGVPSEAPSLISEAFRVGLASVAWEGNSHSRQIFESGDADTRNIPLLLSAE